VLHDIGKGLTHEVEGSHALIGAEIARKYGESEDVVHAIEAHHNEVEMRTVEAVLTQAADAMSGGRPGARRESLEMYVRRLERLEQIAAGKEGVEKVFAMQAGREIRVMVKPDKIDDIQAQVIARDIAKQVEEELTYPGQIRVTVVRESRATEFARLGVGVLIAHLGRVASHDLRDRVGRRRAARVGVGQFPQVTEVLDVQIGRERVQQHQRLVARVGEGVRRPRRDHRQRAGRHVVHRGADGEPGGP
jgi:hypothetical protein